MHNPQHARKGFTLVEVIVVLVVLAILAAIMIPALTGWINKARQKQLVVECRTCVTAAQTLTSEAYGQTGKGTAPNAADVLALARVPGAVSGISLLPDSARIGHLAYSDGTDSVVYCANADDHPEHYNFRAGGPGFSPDGSQIGQSVSDLIDIAAKTGYGPRIDSTANTEGGESTFLEIMMQDPDWADFQQGLQNINVKDWSIQKEGSQIAVWITDQDLGQYQPGEWVRVIRYNKAQDIYTAGYLQVMENDGKIKFDRVNSITSAANDGVWKEYPGQDKNTTKKDAAATADIFNDMPVVPMP